MLICEIILMKHVRDHSKFLSIYFLAGCNMVHRWGVVNGRVLGAFEEKVIYLLVQSRRDY